MILIQTCLVVMMRDTGYLCPDHSPVCFHYLSQRQRFPKYLNESANLKKRDKSVDENRLPQLPRALHEGLHYLHYENDATGERSAKILACGVKYIQPAIMTVVKQPKQVRFNLHNDYPHGYHTDKKRFDYHGHNRKEHHMNEWTSYRDICAV